MKWLTGKEKGPRAAWVEHYQKTVVTVDKQIDNKQPPTWAPKQQTLPGGCKSLREYELSHTGALEDLIGRIKKNPETYRAFLSANLTAMPERLREAIKAALAGEEETVKQGAKSEEDCPW